MERECHEEVYIAAVDMIRFGRYIDSSIMELSADSRCMPQEAGLEKSDIQYSGFQPGWGTRICIRGQVAPRPMGIGGIPSPMWRTRAGGSTALHHAWMGGERAV